MATTRTEKEKYELFQANLPMELSTEAKSRIKKLKLSINSVIQAAMEDFLDWDGKPRWLLNRDLYLHGKKVRLKK